MQTTTDLTTTEGIVTSADLIDELGRRADVLAHQRGGFVRAKMYAAVSLADRLAEKFGQPVNIDEEALRVAVIEEGSEAADHVAALMHSEALEILTEEGILREALDELRWHFGAEFVADCLTRPVGHFEPGIDTLATIALTEQLRIWFYDVHADVQTLGDNVAA